MGGREAFVRSLVRQLSRRASPSAVRGGHRRDFALQFTTQGLDISLLGSVNSCDLRVCGVSGELYVNVVLTY